MLFLEFLAEGIDLWEDDRKKDAIGFFIMAFIALAILLATPYFTIESLNYLFSLSIPVDFLSWCSVYWLMFLVRTTLPKGRTLQNVNNAQEQHRWVTHDIVPMGADRITPTTRNNEEDE